MAVGPFHGRLQHVMKPIQADLERDDDPALNLGHDIVEDDLEAGDFQKPSYISKTE